MTAVVTLDVFSGASNPTWELSDTQIRHLRTLIDGLQHKSLLKAPAVTGRLGYNGFRVDSAQEPLDRTIMASDGVIDLERFVPSKLDPERKIETFLLETGRRVLKPGIIEHVEKRFSHSSRSIERPDILAPVPYDAGKWNNDPTIQGSNNCYNYANDTITNTMAQPGRGSGLIYTSFDCANVGVASTRDGLVRAAKPTTTPRVGFFVALVIWPGNDYHWYRLDDNAYWSHKRGTYPAKNVDESGNPIADPETCDRADYTVFCDYYLIDPANVTIA